MKELTIEEKAKRYDEAFEKAKNYHKQLLDEDNPEWASEIEKIFPELKESEDERIRKDCIKYLDWEYQHCPLDEDKMKIEKCIAWLEKQGKHSIYNVPSREVILAIWDLGNEWKELTNGSISTEYGTQLDYIQKHWHESEYYLKEKQGEQKDSEDEKIRKAIIDFLWKEKIFLQEAHSSVENNPKYRFVMDAINWLEKQCEQKNASQISNRNMERYAF